jgi:hypothetical protein
MKRLLPRLAVRLTVLAAAIAAAVSPMGPAAADAVSAPSNLLNLGTGKILSWGGEVDPPPGGALHLWVRVAYPGIGALPGFVAPYQLRNPVTGLCLQDYADGAQVVLTVCQTDPAADSSQLWQHHRLPDRIAHERPFGFLFNRSSGRVLTAAPSTGNQPTPVLTVAPSDPHSAEAPLQLWTALAP